MIAPELIAAPMTIAHLTSSSFFGGPERQMLGAARAMADSHRAVFLAFREHGKCEGLLREVERFGFEAVRLTHNFPHVRRVIAEIADHLHRTGAAVLCCHGYKADLLGLAAARKIGIPVVSVSHGWTGATWKVRLNELADRFCLRWFDCVVAVSHAQAAKILKTGVSPRQIVVIQNAVEIERFEHMAPVDRASLAKLFPSPRSGLILAVGRLSPEKGFADLIDAMADVARVDPSAGLVIVGDGPLRESLARRIRLRQMEQHIVLAGFRADVAQLLAGADVLAISSYTEGLPTVLLEAFASGVPVVATGVGGIPEVLQDGANGCLIEPGDTAAMARRLCELLADESLRHGMGRNGAELVRRRFTFERQKHQYQQLFHSLVRQPHASVDDLSRDQQPDSGALAESLREGAAS